MTIKIAVCITAWENEPRLVKGKPYKVEESFWQNGEGHFALVDDDGTKFDAPDVFFEYDYENYN